MDMKKILTGAALAAMALLASCNSLELPQEPVASGASGGVSEQTYFTATLDAQTKTYLESEGGLYKTYWSEGDAIRVYDNDTGNYEDCPLVEGAGTTTGKFAGSIQAKNYVAVYGESFWREEADCYGVYMSTWPDYNKNGSISMFDKGEFPMMAKSTGKTFSFKNLCSVLKVNVTGEGEYLYTITVTPNDGVTPVAGDMRVLFNGTTPSPQPLSEDTGSTSLTRSVYSQIGDTPLEVFIVLPAQTYPEGFTLRLETDEGEKDFKVTGNVELGRSRIRNLNLSYSEGLSAQNNLVIEMTTDDGESWRVTEYMEYRDGWYVMENLNLSYREQFRIYNTDTGDYYGCSGDYGNSRGKTNTKVNLGYGSEWWWMWADAAGVYDIYLDLENEFIYMMSDGYTPESLPTDEHVLYDHAEDIAYYASDGELVKVSGIVLAKCGNGFIVAMNSYMRNNIYVYDPRGVYPVELGNVVDLYAEVYEYRGLKELVIPSTVSPWYHILDSSEYDYIPESPRVISDLSSFSSLTFDYISYVGTLEISGSYYNVKVDGQTGYKGSISSPIMDLTPYNGKKVLVEGYYIGNSTSGSTTYLNVMMKRITLVTDENSGGSSTEDITPGESFPVTRRSLDIE